LQILALSTGLTHDSLKQILLREKNLSQLTWYKLL